MREKTSNKCLPEHAVKYVRANSENQRSDSAHKNELNLLE